MIGEFLSSALLSQTVCQLGVTNMKNETIKGRLLRSSILAGVAVSMVSVAAPAFAQEDGVEEIFVTGSRIGRSDLTSALPVSVYDAEDIALSGEGTLENFIQSIPSVNGYMRGSGINNGTDGRATISLRGLGAGRTLVLINGRRPAPTGTGGEVDLNNIPASIIERVEVLRDGASTIYGSDAIGGVVNLITKSNFEGAEITLQHDISDENDGKQYKAAMTIGGNVGRGNIVINAEYTRRDVINQGDRPFSSCPLKESGGELLCGGSGTAYPGHLWAFGTAYNEDPITDINDPDFDQDALDNWTQTSPYVEIWDPTDVPDGYTMGSGTPSPFQVSDQYNYAAKSILVTPQEVYSINGFANYDLWEDTWFGDVNAILETSFTERRSEQLLAPVGTFWGPELSTAQIGELFGWDQAAIDQFSADIFALSGAVVIDPGSYTGSMWSEDYPIFTSATVDGGWIARRLAEAGGRASSQHVQSYRIVAGLEGEWENGWTWDVSYNHGSWTNMPIRSGFINQDRVGNLFDQALCDADDDCPGIWNLLVKDSLTPEMINYISTDYSNVNKSKQTVFNANIAGSFDDFLLLDGDIGWALGIEHRKARALAVPDAAAALGQIYGVGAEVTEGKYHVSEFYAEVSLPILQGRRYAESLSVDFSGRWSEYSTAGNASNWKVGGEYAPTEDVRIRASYNTGLRAPGIGELFAPQQQSAQSYVDPCLEYATSGVSATIQANCAGDGLPGTFTLGSNQATSLFGGNPDLKPEESEAFTVGVVFTPSMAPNWTATVDYFDYEITDAIGTAGTDNVITGCYDSVGFSSPLCALMIGPAAVGDSAGSNGDYRDVFKAISGVLLTQANLGTYETSGVDFSVNYAQDVPADWAGDFDLGEFSAGLSGTVIDTYQYTAFAGAPVTDLKGTFGEDPWEAGSAAFPELRMNAQAGLATDLWSVNWTGRYMSSVDDYAACAGLSCSADSMLYHDIQGSMYLQDGMYTLTFGVRNVADLEPPYVSNYDDMNTIQASYDTQGRYYYMRAVASF